MKSPVNHLSKLSELISEQLADKEYRKVTKLAAEISFHAINSINNHIYVPEIVTHPFL